MRSICEAMFDDGHGVPADRLDWLVNDYADFSRYVGAKTRLAFRAVLLLMQILPVFVVFRPVPFTWLSLPTRRRFLAKLESSKVAFLVTALKAPLTMIYFEHPDVLAKTGYDGRAHVDGEDKERSDRAPAKAGVVKSLPVARAS